LWPKDDWFRQVSLYHDVISGKLFPHKYENAMAIQKASWRYIRNTDISGYLTIEELLYELVSTVVYVCIHVIQTHMCVYGCMYVLSSYYNALSHMILMVIC